MIFNYSLIKASIVHTDLNPDSSFIMVFQSNANLVPIDFNGDGVPEVKFRYDCWSATGWFVHIYSGNNITSPQMMLKGTATNSSGVPWVDPLSLNTAINSTKNWGYSVYGPLLGDPQDANFHNIGDKYIGVKFTISGNTHYGWILASFSNLTVTIKEYAYEGIPNTAINAGDTGGGPSATYDIAMDSISMDTIFVKGNIQVKGRIKNVGSISVDSFNVVYKIDGTSPSVVYSVIANQSIAANQTYSFICNVPWNANSLGSHTIEITASNPNGSTDINIANNSMTKSILILNEKYTKTLVCEEAGGTWCMFCPRGLVGLNTMAHNHPDSLWIGIAVHINGNCHSTYTDEPMVDTAYETGIKSVIQFVPTGVIDRNKDDISNMTMVSLEKALTDHANDLPLGKVAITQQSWSGRDFTIETKSKFALDFNSANYRVALVVLEDDVTGTAIEWAQHDYFQGLSIPMVDWDGFNYNTKGTLVIEGGHYVPAALMHYNHVARQLIGGWNGVANSIPMAITNGTQYSYTFTGSIPADHSPNNSSFVVLLIDNNTGRIINADKVKSNTVIGISTYNDMQSQIRLYPNPSSGFFIIENAKGSQITIYSIMGQCVFEKMSIKAIEHLDLSFLNAGNFFIKISNTDFTTIKKVSILK
jgi:hypothetical protein